MAVSGIPSKQTEVSLTVPHTVSALFLFYARLCGLKANPIDLSAGENHSPEWIPLHALAHNYWRKPQHSCNNRADKIRSYSFEVFANSQTDKGC